MWELAVVEKKLCDCHANTVSPLIMWFSLNTEFPRLKKDPVMRVLAVSVPCWKKNYVILRKQAHLNKCLPKEACPFSYTHTWHLSLSSLSTYFWMPDRPKWSKKGKKLREIDVKSQILFSASQKYFFCALGPKKWIIVKQKKNSEIFTSNFT